MASWGMLGAGLSAMGDTLGKYAMQRISSDEALAREKSLADYKIEMQEKMDARAAEAYAKKVGAARTAAQGSLQGRIDDETRLPGLLSTRARTEAAWNDRQPAGAPVIRPEDQTTEETALRDLSAQDRDVLRQNIAENIAYAKSLRPSGAQVDMETFRQLRQSDPSVAEKFGKELKTEADVIKALKPEKADTKFFHRERTGEITAVTADGQVVMVKKGVEPPDKGDKGDKAKDATLAQKANNAEIGLARQQLVVWQQKNPTADPSRSESIKATLKIALQRKVGDDPEFDAFKKHLAERLTPAELEAVTHPKQTGTGSSVSTPQPLNLNNYRTNTK